MWNLRKKDGNHLWHATHSPLAGQELYSYNQANQVLVAPSNFTYGVEGETTSWSSFGQWFANLNKSADALPANEAAVIRNLIKDIPDTSEIVKKLYHYLQEKTTFVNVSIDFGGMKSYPASYVSYNKYGDCKALSTYMKAMLKAVGIKSYYTLIRAGESASNILADLPSQQFNHVILSVPLQEDTIWLENTTNALPYNYLGTFTQNRHGLFIDGLNSKLVTTPVLNVSNVKQERNFYFNPLDSEKWEAEIALKIGGDKFEKLRFLLNNEQDMLPELQNQSGLDGLEIDHWEVQDYERDSQNIAIEIHGRASSFIHEVGQYTIINPLKITIPKFEKPSDRKTDLRFPYPIHKQDQSIYNLGKYRDKKITIPKSISLSCEYGVYTTQITRRDQEIEVVETFILHDKFISTEAYTQFYEFLQTIEDYKKEATILMQ